MSHFPQARAGPAPPRPPELGAPPGLAQPVSLRKANRSAVSYISPKRAVASPNEELVELQGAPADDGFRRPIEKLLKACLQLLRSALDARHHDLALFGNDGRRR